MKLNIAHLYPELLNLYGDAGNIASLKKRAVWRNINAEVIEYAIGDKLDFTNTDIIYIGGGTEKAIKTVLEELKNFKGELKEYVENNGSILAVCGGYQILGNSFKLGDEIFEGLGVLDIDSKYQTKRLIGNVILKCGFLDKEIVGFENRNGITNINNLNPLGKVLYGNGDTEGVVYKNVIGTYLHGPLLPKNPHLCDYILKKALTQKAEDFVLKPLDDNIELSANEYILNRFLK